MATLTLRPNADGTYSTWSEISNAGHLFSDQFEEGDFSAWTGSSVGGTGTKTISNEAVHHGGYAFKVTVAAASDYGRCYKTIAGTNLVYMRFYVRFTALPPATNGRYFLLAQLSSASYAQIQARLYRIADEYKWAIQYRAAGALTVVYSDVSKNPSVDTWYCIELMADLSTNDGDLDGNYKMWVNGTELNDISQANVDTDGTTIITLWLYDLTSHAVNSTIYTDCVVASTSGPIGVESRKDLVDDESDNTALRNTCYAGETVAYSTRKTTYNLTDHGAETGTITNVTAYCRAKYSTGGGNEGFKLIWKLAATEVQSAEKTPTNAFAEYSDSRDTDPDGGAWSWADVDALEIGAVASALAATEAIDISEFWIVVTYAPAAGGAPKGSNLVNTMIALLNSKMLYG